MQDCATAPISSAPPRADSRRQRPGWPRRTTCWYSAGRRLPRSRADYWPVMRTSAERATSRICTSTWRVGLLTCAAPHTFLLRQQLFDRGNLILAAELGHRKDRYLPQLWWVGIVSQGPLRDRERLVLQLEMVGDHQILNHRRRAGRLDDPLAEQFFQDRRQRATAGVFQKRGLKDQTTVQLHAQLFVDGDVFRRRPRAAPPRSRAKTARASASALARLRGNDCRPPRRPLCPLWHTPARAPARRVAFQ